MKRGLALLVCLCGCGPTGRVEGLPALPWTQAPDLELDLRAWQSADRVALLAPMQVVVDLYCGPDIECAFTPTVPAGFVGSVDAGAFAPLGQGRTRRFVLALRPSKLGEVEIAPWRAETKAEPDAAEPKPIVATTPAMKVTVESVLGEHGAGVEAPAPPFAPRFDPTPWLIGAGVAVLLVTCLWWWRRHPRGSKRAADETRLPAHVTALRALARLRSANRNTPDEVDAFYVEVSRILRAYLEERFGLHAPERTTEEFLAELNAQGPASPLDGEQRGALAGFLRQCDLVKFARVLPDEAVHAESLRFAEELVEATRPDRVLQEAAS